MAVAEAVAVVLLGLAVCTSAMAAAAGSVRGEVTYDHRALVLDGTRRMLFSGEIHYPRSTPE
ncbi:hypothetical protein ACP70R_034342 [Stipagrostis hirtigluma subsp. patula]